MTNTEAAAYADRATKRLFTSPDNFPGTTLRLEDVDGKTLAEMSPEFVADQIKQALLSLNP